MAEDPGETQGSWVLRPDPRLMGPATGSSALGSGLKIQG